MARALAAEHGGRIALGLGHSFGGTAMLLAAAAEPVLFERLVLVDPVLHEPRGAESHDPQRSARASQLVERAFAPPRGVSRPRMRRAKLGGRRILFAPGIRARFDI